MRAALRIMDRERLFPLILSEAIPGLVALCKPFVYDSVSRNPV